MDTAEIVLVNPPPARAVELHDMPPYGHLGLAYIAAALRREGLVCRVVDSKLGRMSFDNSLRYIAGYRPKIVGITSYTHEINRAAQLAMAIKERIKGVVAVIGGAHASSLPAYTLRNFEWLDYLVKGEGERSFTELCKAVLDGRIDFAQTVPGIAFRKEGGVTLNAPSGWIEELDSLAFPAWDLFPKMTVFPVAATRGCPYKCVFCARMLGEKTRRRSPVNIVEELVYINERFHAGEVEFCDETFGIKKDWLAELLDLIKKKDLPKKLKWTITTRAQLLDEDTVRGLKEAGCSRVGFGIESGDDRILKLIKKGEEKEDFIKATKLLRRYGIVSGGYYILGHPFETRESAIRTINFAAELNTDYISIGIMIPYPGTEVADMVSRGEGNYKKRSLAWEDYNKELGNAIELEGLSRHELTKLQLLGYLKFYALNFKILPFFIRGWKYRRLNLAFISKYLKELIKK